MADTTKPSDQTASEAPLDKGKGKAVQQPQDTEMDEDDDSSSEEENEVEQAPGMWTAIHLRPALVLYTNKSKRKKTTTIWKKSPWTTLSVPAHEARR